MGPGIDPQEIIYVATNSQYVKCLLIGLVLLYLGYKTRNGNDMIHRFIVCTCVVVFITIPWAGVLDDAVIGSYPTIDKKGVKLSIGTF